MLTSHDLEFGINMKSNEEEHIWKYASIGGMTRIDINSGEDIARLGELEQTKWTVLSCPVKELHFDKATLEILDGDNDGRIHANDVIEKAQWLTSVLSNPDTLIYGKSSVSIEDINPESENGARILAAANEVFDLIKKEDRSSISQEDVDKAVAVMTSKKERVLPYGENSDAAAEIVGKMDAKIKDYFSRCALEAFVTGSGETKEASLEQVASLPLFHVKAEEKLPLHEVVNPAWKEDFAKLKALVLDVEFPNAEDIDKTQWNSVLAKIDEYVKSNDTYHKKESDTITELSKFIILSEHFYHFLRNFLTFSDFYSKKEDWAIFQAGKLYIDQRCCALCVEVNNMAAHNETASLSGMYLLYCDCTLKNSDKHMAIVAAMTRGDVDNLRIGKNALFYDREGNEWDAIVTKIIDNPISIKQAFWYPYRKFWTWITEKVNKSAEEKEAAAIDTLTDTSKTKQAFDIAKFAGIFAAIGMAIGYISSAIVNLANGIMAKWYNLPLMIIAFVLVVSGPSMLLAWNKLRKRNLAPILNANGWAINAAAIINVTFGATLTEEAKYPGLELVDPIAAKKFKETRSRRYVYIALALLLIAFAVLYFTNRLAPLGLPW